MSRSKKKNPFGGIAGNQSEKAHKRHTHKTARRVVRDVLSDFEEGDEVLMPQKPRDAVNPWNGPKDGKTMMVKLAAPPLMFYGSMAEYEKAYRKFMAK